MFQSRDWVDVDSGRMLTPMWGARLLFQSRDWVDVDSGSRHCINSGRSSKFQSRDWVDVDSGALLAPSHRSESDWVVSPTLGVKRGEK